jgi:outer membrane protein
MRKVILAAAIAALSCGAVAHEAGEVVLRVGVIHAAPDGDSSRIKVGGTRLRGTSAEVKSDTQLGLTATYMVMPHFGIEVLAATPFTHEIRVKGVDRAVGLPPGTVDGKFGETSHLPPTVSAQYFFLNPKSRFQPYVGLGLTYTAFFSEKLTSRQKDNGFSNLSLEDSIGLSPQTGIDFAITDNLQLNAAVWRLGISTKAKFRLGGTKGSVDVDVTPWVYFLGLGYKF